MSRRMYNYQHPQHGPLQVIGGWDRPLQGFHLTIKKLEGGDEESDESPYLFLNFDPSTFPPNLPPSNRAMIPFASLEAALKHFEIPTPQGFLEDIQNDQRMNRGNCDKGYVLKASRQEKPWVLEIREGDWQNESGDCYAGRHFRTRHPSERAAIDAAAQLDKTTESSIFFSG